MAKYLDEKGVKKLSENIKIYVDSSVPTNNNQLTNGAGYITSSGSCSSAIKAEQDSNGNNIVNTYGAAIEMSIDNSTYVVSLKLKNAEGTQLGETQTIDLPIESMVVNGSYDSSTKEVVLTLDNGNEVRFSVADLVSGLAKTSDLASYVPTSRTVNGKSLTDNISLSYSNVGALPNFSLNINHGTAGNPRQVKFLSVDYNTKATYFKMGATSCHDNGTSYQFLEDIIIGVTTGGKVVCNVYKYCQAEVTLDNVTRNYGDVFYVIDTANKIVDFYILCGQYASSQFTPATKIGNTTIAYITQYTGTATYYSSGDKIWANGNSTTYAKLSDMSDKANLNGGNTFSDTQIITGYLDIRGTAADKHLKTRGIGGSDGNGNSSDLYLQYGSDYKTYFGKTGQSTLNSDGTITINGSKAATINDIPTNNNQLTNGAGYITSIKSSDVTTALGYTPVRSPTLLWSGTASTAGTTSISGLSNYSWFIAKVQFWSGESRCYYQFCKIGDTITFYGNIEHYWENKSMQGSRRNFTLSSTGFTITNCIRSIQDRDDMTANDDLRVRELYGIK